MYSILGSFFEKFEAAELVVNVHKYEFGKQEVNYLGRQVGRGLVMPRQAKVQAILDFPEPNIKKELMCTLGTHGFYQRFMPNFARVVAPDKSS